MTSTLVSVDNLNIAFRKNGVDTIAVRKLTFSIKEGETLAIVGESGSGKSLTALSLIGLLPPVAEQTGSIQLTTDKGTFDIRENGHDLRGNEIGMVFQEPMSSLNPVMKIGKQITEAIMLHRQVKEQEAKKIATDCLAKVQLPDPA